MTLAEKKRQRKLKAARQLRWYRRMKTDGARYERHLKIQRIRDRERYADGRHR